MFSVIIPTYNRLELLKRAIESVLNQSFQEFEIIVIDDCSSDDTWEWLKKNKDERIRSFINSKNKGLSFNRNFGVSKSIKPFIAFLDDDDLWSKEHLLNLRELINKFNNCGLYCTNYFKINNNTTSLSNINIEGSESIIIDYFNLSSRGDIVSLNLNTAFRKQIFNEFGGFNETLKYSGAEDIELFTKIAIKYKVAYSPEPTCYYNTANLYQRENMIYTETNILDFSQFIKFEMKDSSLKRWLDLNRFSIARMLILSGQRNRSKRYIQEINKNNINIIKYYSLYLPSKILIIINKIYFKAKLFLS